MTKCELSIFISQKCTHGDTAEVMHTLLRTVIQAVVHMYLENDRTLIVSIYKVSVCLRISALLSSMEMCH